MSATPTEGTPAALWWDQLSQAYTASAGIWSAWADAWQSLLTNRGVPATKAMLEQATNPAAWPGGFATLIKELEDIFALPRFADLPGLDPSALPSMAPSAELMALGQEYMLTVMPLWARICLRFQEEVATRRQRGEAMDNAGAAMDLWNNILDRALMEFNRSTDFAHLQQRFLRAAMRQRLEVRKMAEQAARAVDLPTRTELDDIYHRLHDLTREVHGLRRELRTLRQTGGNKRALIKSDRGS